MPTFTPPVTDGRLISDPAQRGRSSAHALWSHYGAWATGQTVWKDSSGVWHTSLTPYQGGAVNRVFRGGVLVSETGPDEGLATAQVVYLGGHDHPVDDDTAAELRAAGFYVGGRWESEQDRWVDLVISNPVPGRSFIGGDATSSVDVPASNLSLWAHADSLYGTIDSEGYLHSTGLVKNSLITRAASGSLSQVVFAFGGTSASPAWAHPNHPSRGFTQMDMVLDGSGDALVNVVVIGWAEPQTFDGTINDGVVMTMNAFGGASTWSAFDTGGGMFLPTSVHNQGAYHYVIGRETNLLEMFPNGLVVGQPWEQDNQTNWSHLARVPLGTLPTTSGWEFWTGSGWATGVANGITVPSRLVDSTGQAIPGTSDLTFHNGEFILATIPSTVSPSIWLYRADAAEGPYTRYATLDPGHRVPTVGPDPPDGLRYWFAFPKFHEHLEPDTQTFLLSCSQGAFPPIIGTSALQAASASAPSFVFAPKPEASP